jgi:hypothetical protein
VSDVVVCAFAEAVVMLRGFAVHRAASGDVCAWVLFVTAVQQAPFATVKHMY